MAFEAAREFWGHLSDKKNLLGSTEIFEAVYSVRANLGIFQAKWESEKNLSRLFEDIFGDIRFEDTWDAKRRLI